MLLPRLILIADRFANPAVAGRAVAAAVAAVEGGVPWVHLRDHEAAPGDFAAAARQLAERLRRADEPVVVSINTRLDLAGALGAGAHLGFRGPPVREARRVLPPEAPVGFSAHDREGAQQAVAEGVDYLFLSPIFPTRSKPGQEGLGLTALRAFCAAFPETPVYALGGVTPARVAPCLKAGARGVAVLSGILHADAPAAAAQAYLSALRSASNPPSTIRHPA